MSIPCGATGYRFGEIQTIKKKIGFDLSAKNVHDPDLGKL